MSAEIEKLLQKLPSTVDHQMYRIFRDCIAILDERTSIPFATTFASASPAVTVTMNPKDFPQAGCVGVPVPPAPPDRPPRDVGMKMAEKMVVDNPVYANTLSLYRHDGKKGCQVNFSTGELFNWDKHIARETIAAAINAALAEQSRAHADEIKRAVEAEREAAMEYLRKEGYGTSAGILYERLQKSTAAK